MASCFCSFNAARQIFAISYSGQRVQKLFNRTMMLYSWALSNLLYCIFRCRAVFILLVGEILTFLSSIFLFTDHALTHWSMFHGIPVTGGVGGGKIFHTHKKKISLHILTSTCQGPFTIFFLFHFIRSQLLLTNLNSMRSVVKPFIFIYKGLVNNMFHDMYKCRPLSSHKHLLFYLFYAVKQSLQLCLFQEVKLYKNAREREK